MKSTFYTLLAFALITVTSCTDEIVLEQPDCSINATVVDMTGLDGCGYMFKLENGDLLEPIMLLRCGTPPIPDEVLNDPMYNFVFENGKRVKIDYELPEEFYGSICMAGKQVFITCIQEVGQSGSGF